MKDARAAALRLEALRAKIVLRERPDAGVHALDWPELEALLPDGGFTRGSVVELASPGAAGGGTLLAVRALRALQHKDPRAVAAWLDPDATLYGPGLLRAGIDLARLLVVRPPPADVGRFAVKVVASGAVELMVVGLDPVFGASRPAPRAQRGARRPLSDEVVVRKLALAVESADAARGGGATVLLLTDARVRRPLPLPVALRLELARTPDALVVRVAKDRRGRGGVEPRVVSLPGGHGEAVAGASAPDRARAQGE